MRFFYAHSGTEVGAAYADVNEVGDGFVGDASVAAVVECFGVGEGAVEFVVEFGEDVFAVNVNGRGVGRQAQGGMEDGAVFAEVDFFAVLHDVHLSGKGRGFGKAAQKLQSVFAEAVFAVIEEEAVEGFVHIAEAVGFIQDELNHRPRKTLGYETPSVLFLNLFQPLVP